MWPFSATDCRVEISVCVKGTVSSEAKEVPAGSGYRVNLPFTGNCVAELLLLEAMRLAKDGSSKSSDVCSCWLITSTLPRKRVRGLGKIASKLIDAPACARTPQQRLH